jgi:hypothetical protein
MRFVVNGANMSVQRSLDGVKWSQVNNMTGAIGFTPTHFGFGVSTWGGNAGATWNRLTSVDYIRMYDLT